MPKIPTNPHPLHIVRKELGWTQQRLAEKCGVTAVTIKKIEGRRLQPGRELLGRITWVTGVDPGSLSGKAPTFQNGPYKGGEAKAIMGHLETFRKGEFTEGASTVFFEKRLESNFSMLASLFEGAAKRNALMVVLWSLQNWMADTMVEFGLGEDFLKLADPSDADSKFVATEVKARIKARKSKR